MKVRTLIVDDMLLARRRIERHLASDPDIVIVGECSGGAEAIEAIRDLRPDLLFLDVQMPEIDGFEVLETVGPGAVKAVVFVTAYDEFALRAFEVHALDYLLKPFDQDRLARAVERAKRYLETRSGRGAEGRIDALLDSTAARRRSGRLTLKVSGKTVFLAVREIDYIEAAGNYLKVHAGRDSYLVRERLHAMEAQLDPNQFARIHRSTLVNVARVREMHPLFNGDQALVLHDKRQLTLSRTYRDRFLAILDRQT